MSNETRSGTVKNDHPDASQDVRSSYAALVEEHARLVTDYAAFLDRAPSELATFLTGVRHAMRDAGAPSLLEVERQAAPPRTRGAAWRRFGDAWTRERSISVECAFLIGREAILRYRFVVDEIADRVWAGWIEGYGGSMTPVGLGEPESALSAAKWLVADAHGAVVRDHERVVLAATPSPRFVRTENKTEELESGMRILRY